MGREENVAVFEDTMKLCKENEKVKAALRESVAGQRLVCEWEEIPAVKKDIYSQPCKVVVSKKRTYEAASAYRDNQVCVLNFASASNPGGGVARGANAQEECLCRCSDLYACLNTVEMWNGFYQPHRNEANPLHNDDIIYTPGVLVMKSDTAMPKLLSEKDWYRVNVVTCAAPNLRQRPSNQYNSGDGDKAAKITDKELLALHEKRLRRILDVAVQEGNEVVVLGAFGCGAFANSPEVVARASKNVIQEYRNAFRTIEFAVYCSPMDDTNYKVFERVLRGIL